MPDLNISQTTRTDLENIRTDYSVDTKETDGVSEQTETTWTYQKWTKYLGYWKTIPEYKSAINAYANWVVGRGWNAPSKSQKRILEGITGWGEDNLQQILFNLIVVKKVNGDAFAEIIRNPDGNLRNLKPLSPGSMRVVVNRKGIIIRYEQISRVKEPDKKFKPEQILHLVNDRIADEIHGTSITEAVEWVILARNEAMTDWRRISHRSTIRVMYIDADNITKLNDVKKEYATAIEKGELMLIPAKKGEAEFGDLVVPPIDAFLSWIRYLENFFYQSLGVPKVILGGGGDGEGDNKMSYLSFAQVYINEVEELKADLWNQAAIKITFPEPVSIKDNVQENEIKNTSQTGFQPNDAQAGVGA